MTSDVKEFVLTHVVKDVSSMEEGEKRFSPTEEHFKIPWELGISRKNGYLGFFLNCKYTDTVGCWSINTKRVMRILCVANGKKYEKKAGARFKKENNLNCSSFGYHKFMNWETLKKDYIVDGDLIIQVHVTIYKMNEIQKKTLRRFDESMKKYSDVVLIVENEKFYVSKLTLAAQSSFFEALFETSFKKKEIILTDVNSKNFQNFLELVYGELPIDEKTIDGILNVAFLYDAQPAIRKCEEYLIKECEKTLKEKLQLVKSYHLKSLKTVCLSKVNSVKEIREVMPKDFKEMDQSVVRALFKKLLAIPG